MFSWCGVPSPVFALSVLTPCFWILHVLRDLSVDSCPLRCNLSILLKHLSPNSCDLGILSGDAYDPPTLLVPKATFGTGVRKVAMEEPMRICAIFGITFFMLALQLVQNGLEAKPGSICI